MNELKGVGVALVTPFKEDLSIDHASLAKLVQHNIDNGTDYLVVLGTTGESVTLSANEKVDVIQTIQSANNGKLPLVLGIGGNNTANVAEEIKTTDLNNFTAVLSASPSYNKPSQEGIYQHYKSLTESTDKPIILYNVPGRTSSNISADTTLRLAKDFKNIVAIKEASPNFLQSTEIIKNKPEDFLVISGDDEFALPMTLAGGSGVISVIGQALGDYTDMIHLALNHDVQKAYTIHYKLMDIIRAIYVEGNPTGIKSLLSAMNICQPYTRLPLMPATKDYAMKLKQSYEELNR